MDKTSELVDTLSSIELDHVFNPYRDRCTIFDKHDAIFLRKRNLSQYFSAAKERQISTVWVGEALGYRGGRRTGIPLSDNYHLEKIARYYGCELVNPTVDDVAEVTAKVVWDELNNIETKIFMWNAFPFHPHQSGKPLSNRKPKISEMEKVRHIHQRMFDLFEFEEIYAIGRSAEAEIDRLGYDTTYIRHPSHGGANIFRETVKQLYYM